jgi:hypothetical protein
MILFEQTSICLTNDGKQDIDPLVPGFEVVIWQKGYIMGISAARLSRLSDSLHFEARNLTLTCRKFCSHYTKTSAKAFLVDGKRNLFDGSPVNRALFPAC